MSAWLVAAAVLFALAVAMLVVFVVTAAQVIRAIDDASEERWQ
jgi:hypothetical protein